MPDPESRSCPTIKQLLNGVRNLTTKGGLFQAAWTKSFPTPHFCAEQGGFIYIDFPVPAKVTRAYVVFAPPGTAVNQRAPGWSGPISLNRPGIDRINVILVSTFHTHPLSNLVTDDDNLEPSQQDKEYAYIRGVPGILISRNGIYSYGPTHRENLDNRKGYPPPITQPPPGVLRATLERRPPPPWAVKDQWPEGTGEDLRMSVRDGGSGLRGGSGDGLHTRTVSGEGGEGGVIVAEWSDADVIHYG